jgi:hypothetical protein
VSITASAHGTTIEYYWYCPLCQAKAHLKSIIDHTDGCPLNKE